jgi:hypothetical protein
MLNPYLKKISEISNRGDAREETYYPVLKDLLSEYCGLIGKKNIHITILPKKTEAGNPDFRVWDGKQHITGYIEAKDPSVENLDRIEETEQLKRYLHTFPNLILTNFLEFRLYRNGELTDKVLIGRPVILHKLKTVPPVEKEPELLHLLEKFFSFSLPKVYDAKSLAVELAKRTRFLRNIVALSLAEEDNPPIPPLSKGGKGGFIRGFYKAFKDYLIIGLKEDDFSDLYAQTVAYGLFAARTRSGNSFNRKLAYDHIPHTIGILRDVFKFISLGELPPQMEWIIDDISEVLSVTDVYSILDKYFREHRGKDPVVHFYETFLAEYDPATREKRGVYYTPEPVVSYIVRSLHNILKEQFDRPDGFAGKAVTVLDPAAGTLTFLAEASKSAVEEFVSKYGEGGKEKLIKEHILKNFYAFELMMAPYAVGHLKMSFLLEELGYRLKDDDRFKLYLTNTLEMEELEQTELPGMASLSEESHEAGMIKKEKPILVILGNPPYSGHSSNIGDWITKEIRAYYKVDGKPLGEKNPKWLQDDYVKFIRFAQWKIDAAGEGVLGFITNHGYLDNPTFRGMRQSLMESFDEIYILDLHGNSLKKERCPDGSKDENVFDIQQGVAIALFIKKKRHSIKKKHHPEPVEGCKVYHSEIWGLREEKYGWLLKNDIKKTKWKSLTPKSGFYLFIPREERLLKAYEKFMKVTDIFPVNSVGIVTSRDDFVIDADREALKRRIRMFRNDKMPDEIIRESFHLKDKPNWKLKDAREKIRKEENWEDSITKILYRPFDTQWIFYHDSLIERSRKDVMRHMMRENIGLITVRQVAEGVFNHALPATNIVESRITLSNKGIGFLFPLYIYTAKEKPKKRFTFGSAFMLFEPDAEYLVKKPNISVDLMNLLDKAFKKLPSPDEIFHYIYAVLYSNTYRTKYAEFLKIDFPRVPFTKDYKLFKKMSEYGKRLVDLHLLKSPELDSPIVRFQGKGDNRVEKVRPSLRGKAEAISKDEILRSARNDSLDVFINKTQYFEGIPPEVWAYQIGGYRVCEKWLKDRKGKILSLDEIQTYCRIVTAIKKTIELQKTIDAVYNDLEK